MNIPLTISCFFILGFIPISNGCCCTWFCSEGNCNPFGCDCIYEHCGGWLPWCDPNELCEDKKRNMMEGDTEINFENNRDPNVRFNWVDLNKDRSITFDEFGFALDTWFSNRTSRNGHKKEQLFEEMDKDNNKIISPNEFDEDLK